MYVSHKHALVFIRVPKTASSAMFRAIDAHEIGYGHNTAYEAAIHHSVEWNKYAYYRSFGVIRHPVDWVQSFYSHVFTHENEWLRFMGRGLATRDHDAFLNNLSMTPFTWLTHPDTGALMVDEVWRLEDIDSHVADLGLPPLERFNETPANQKRKINWMDDRIELVKKKFARELTYYADLPLEQRIEEVRGQADRRTDASQGRKRHLQALHHLRH